MIDKKQSGSVHSMANTSGKRNESDFYQNQVKEMNLIFIKHLIV